MIWMRDSLRKDGIIMPPFRLPAPLPRRKERIRQEELDWWKWQLAITATLKVNDGQNSAGSTTFTGATSYTPTDNTLQWVAVLIRGGAGISADPTLAHGSNGNFTLIVRHAVLSTTTKTLLVYRNMLTGASSGAFKLDRASTDTWDGCRINCIEFGGVNTTGSAGSGAILQTAYTQMDTGVSTLLSGSITMTTGTALVASAGKFSAEEASTARTSWTQDTENHAGGTNYSFTTEHFISTDTAYSVTWTTNGAVSGIHCSELLASGAADVPFLPLALSPGWQPLITH